MPENGTRDAGIAETIKYIKENKGDDKETLSAILKEWLTNQAFANERARVGDALRRVAPGGADPDKLRRANLLLRAVVLRNDLSKVEREVQGSGDATLATTFAAVLRQCINFTKVIPPWLAPVATESASVNGKEEIQEVALGLEGTEWPEAAKKVIYLVKGAGPDILEHVEWLKDLEGPQIKEGEEGLKELGAGGALYVVGHGNFGTGIGSHKEHLGARKLMAALERDGLPKAPSGAVWVYLWACWTGTSTRRAWGGLGQREPYARRFARALVACGFENYFVVGFAGSVAKGQVIQSYKSLGGRVQIKDAEHFKRGPFVVYEVKGGDFNRVAGEDWTAKSHPTLNFTKDHDMTVERREV